jgi:hypothetical protein
MTKVVASVLPARLRRPEPGSLPRLAALIGTKASFLSISRVLVR